MPATFSPPARFGPYFIEPVIAGLNSPDAPEPNEPFIAASDLVGCLNFAKDFVVSGTASDKLFGMAEGLWEEDLVCICVWCRGLSGQPEREAASLTTFAPLPIARAPRSCLRRSVRPFWARWSGTR